MYPKELDFSIITLFKNNTLPTLGYAHQISDNPNWKHTIHKHDDMCEIILIIEGQGSYIINNEKYLAKKGDLLIYNRGILHDERSDPSNPLKTYCLGINGLHINGLNELQIIPSHVCPVIDTNEKFQSFTNYFETILNEFNAKNKYYEIVCQSLVTTIIILINRMIQNVPNDLNNKKSRTIALKVKEYIDANYMKDLKLDNIAKMFNFSTFYLAHSFKKETFFSPIEYIIQRRIGEAQRLLLYTNKTIKEVGLDVGYNDANYFSLIFKKTTGVSPSSFRKSYKEV